MERDYDERDWDKLDARLESQTVDLSRFIYIQASFIKKYNLDFSQIVPMWEKYPRHMIFKVIYKTWKPL